MNREREREREGGGGGHFYWYISLKKSFHTRGEESKKVRGRVGRIRLHCGDFSASSRYRLVLYWKEKFEWKRILIELVKGGELNRQILSNTALKSTSLIATLCF